MVTVGINVCYVLTNLESGYVRDRGGGGGVLLRFLVFETDIIERFQS